jgi:hypothetical protein
MNGYEYVRSRPVTFNDPKGTEAGLGGSPFGGFDIRKAPPVPMGPPRPPVIMGPPKPKAPAEKACGRRYHMFENLTGLGGDPVAHHYLLVPKWSRGCEKTTKWYRYDVKAKVNYGSALGNAWNVLMAGTIGGGGYVTRSHVPKAPTKNIYDSVESNCEADKKLIEKLERQRNGIDEVYFHALFWNCQNWTGYHFKMFLDE